MRRTTNKTLQKEKSKSGLNGLPWYDFVTLTRGPWGWDCKQKDQLNAKLWPGLCARSPKGSFHDMHMASCVLKLSAEDTGKKIRGISSSRQTASEKPKELRWQKAWARLYLLPLSSETKIALILIRLSISHVNKLASCTSRWVREVRFQSKIEMELDLIGGRFQLLWLSRLGTTFLFYFWSCVAS